MPLFARGEADFNLVFDVDTFSDFVGPGPTFLRAAYDLFSEIGSPTDPVEVAILISSGASLGSLLISDQFNPASTFSITMAGSGRAVGGGGRGGFGGRTELGPTIQYPGGPGLAPQGSPFAPAGLPANIGHGIVSAFDFELNIDDGYVFGGGGGGGGGGYGAADSSATGGGGGGGQGWDNAAGGQTHLGPGSVHSGQPGSLSSPGTGGPFFSSGGNGGDGGTWGSSGNAGATGSGGPGAGGAGGKAIVGLSAITVTLTGTDNQAALEAANRLLGGYTNVTFVDP